MTILAVRDIFNPSDVMENEKILLDVLTHARTCLRRTRIPYKSPSTEEIVKTQFQQKDFNWSQEFQLNIRPFLHLRTAH